ncbi:MAG TPA: peptide ABC transporter substrate-binding protein [Anaerolineae bacterium]|nr:peptide ABC transporter substrate-binding protein [Anaerolineae bacterium]
MNKKFSSFVSLLNVVIGLILIFLVLYVVWTVTGNIESEAEPLQVTRVVADPPTLDAVRVTTQPEVGEVTRIIEVTTTPMPTQEVTRVVEPIDDKSTEDLPITLNINWQSEPPTLDPALATGSNSIDIIGNLFVGLTKIDPVTGDVEPYLATEWFVNEDGTVYTFKLRDDIPWVRYNLASGEVARVSKHDPWRQHDPATGEATLLPLTDEDVDFVDAYDVEYAVKRAIDPATAAPYAYVFYILKNAAAINHSEDGFILDDLGVRVIDETTIEFELEQPAGYFPSIVSMWTAYPVHEATIYDWEDKWTEPNIIVTSGPYVLENWYHGRELTMIKNPFWIHADDVQIERIRGVIIPDFATALAAYENFELDTVLASVGALDHIQTHSTLSAQYYSAPVACTYYYGMTNSKPPFDDRRIRLAFSQAFDRQSLIDNVLKAGQSPASSFAPPGMFGAPVPGIVGVEYDPEGAVALLQEYLDEKGMTIEEFNGMDIVLMHNTSEGHSRIAKAVQAMWKDVLGVEVRIENQEWAVYLDTLHPTTPLEDVPHIWRLGWCADYPDENNWVHEVFNAEIGANRLRREPSRFDELTVEASSEIDPDKRMALYAEAEQILAYDEAAYIPIYHYSNSHLTQSWLTRNYPSFGPADYYNWTIDGEAKQAVQK